MGDPIVAIATPPGESALAVIRVSGHASIAILQTLSAHSIGKHRRAERVFLHHPHTKILLDEVVLVCYKKPSSYTGEEMVEIFCHGGAIPVKNIYDTLVQVGCKPAPPGEFTKRALLNDKIDIFQAESVEQIVKAHSSKEVELSLKTKQGSLSDVFHHIISQFEHLFLELEVRLSFPDDALGVESDPQIYLSIHDLQDEIETMIQSAEYIKKVNTGFSLVLMGRTNVGKSTLFNALAGYERTLVSPYPSTTHDYITESVLWDGYSIALTDTAGIIIQDASPLDSLFNQRMEVAFEKAFLLLYVLDASDCSEEDLQLINTYQDSPLLLVVNKIDIAAQDPSWLKTLTGRIPVVHISAKNKTGIQELIHFIRERIRENLGKEPDYYLNDRHHAILVHIQLILERITSQSTPFMDMVVEDIKEILYILKEELNVSHSKELLQEIFSSFCIGK